MHAVMRVASSSVAILGLVAPALAADGAGLTIYTQDLAMVRETRQVALPAGTGQVTLPGVPAQMRPETAMLKADGVTVLEQSFLPETLSPHQLFERAVGKTVTYVRTNPATGAETRETVEVLAVNDGLIVRRQGKIEVLRPDGMLNRVVFDTVPDGLSAQPTLSMQVRSRGGGTRPVELSYLTGGLSWRADYVGSYDEARGVLNLQGWATLTNHTSIDFLNSRTQLMAGDVNVERHMAPMRMTKAMDAIAESAVAAPAPAREAMGDFHLYTLPQPVTLLRNQTKQVSLLAAQAVKAERSYRFEMWGPQSSEQPQNVSVRVSFKNTDANGLGEPMPGGVVRLYGLDKAGNSQFMGEDRIQHTPEDGTVELSLGRAFDVTVKPTLASRRVLNRGEGPSHTEWSMVYEVKNAKDQPVTVDLRQRGLYGEWEVIQASQKHEKLDGETIGWKVDLPAKGSKTVRVTIRQRG